MTSGTDRLPRYLEVGTARGGERAGDSRTLGHRVATEALAQIKIYDPSVCFVFAADRLRPFEATLAGVKEAIDEYMSELFGADHPGVPMIGCSTLAAIHGEAIVENGLAVSIWASPHLALKTAFAEQVLGFESGRWELKKDPLLDGLRHLGFSTNSRGRGPSRSRATYLLLLTPGLSSLEGVLPNRASRNDEILRFLAEQRELDLPPLLPLWGGAAGAPEIQGPGPGGDGPVPATMQFADYRVKHNSVVLALLSSNLKVGSGMGYGFEPVGWYFFARPDKPPHLETIEGKPIRQFFPSENASIHFSDATFPARKIVYSIRDAKSGAECMTYPRLRAEDSASLLLPEELHSGFFLAPQRVTTSGMVRGVRNALQRALDRGGIDPDRVRALLTVSCRARKRRMDLLSSSGEDDGPEAELQALRAACPSAEVVGWYGNGEIGFSESGGSKEELWSISLLAISDELDQASVNRAGEAAREAAADFVDHLAREMGDADSSLGLLHAEETRMWRAAARLACELTGGGGATLFFKDKRGHFHLGGSTNELTRPSDPEDESATRAEPRGLKPWEVYYEAGDGLTGWVAKTGLTLNIDRRDEEYLNHYWARHPNSSSAYDAPKWGNRITENRDDARKRPELRAPFLATPILLGDVVVGVLRISGTDLPDKHYFTLTDEYVIRSCARVISLAYATLACAKQLRWREIGFLNFARHHPIGAEVAHLGMLRRRCAVISDKLDLSANGPALLEKLDGWHKEFDEACSELRSTYANFANTTKVESEAFRPLDLVRLAHNLVGQFQEKAEPRIRLGKAATRIDTVLVEGSESSLEILLTELITNAKKAFKTGDLPGEIKVDIERACGEHVLLTVADNGLGFGALSQGGGKASWGSGLAICEHIAKQHDAMFDIESSMGGRRGTTITIVFHETHERTK